MRKGDEGEVHERAEDKEEEENEGIEEEENKGIEEEGSQLWKAVICEDGERRMGRIPGKLRRRMWVRENDLLIVVPWSFQDSKADVKFRYTPTQTSNLKRRGKIPEILDIY